MAISDSFNLSNALNSQSYAYKCWYNYYYGSNSMGITSNDMGQITQTWSSELSNWRATATDDENAYEIEDDDYSIAVNNGKESAKDITGYDGEDGGNIANGVISSAGAVGGLAAGVTAAGGLTNAAKSVGGLVQKKGGLFSFGKDAAGKSTSKAAKASAYVAAALAIATAAAYRIEKPNKTEKDACVALQPEMTNANDALTMAQDDMSVAGEEVVALSDEANEYTEGANEQNEEDKALFDLYKASYDALMAKVEAGETLTEEEKSLLNELVPLMQELGVNIEETTEDTTSTVGDIYGEMESYQADYDNAASTMGEVEGLTDYAEGFDSATKTMCYVEGTSQSLNAISGAVAGAQLMGMGFWNWALGLASIAAGVSSGVGAAEQFKMASEVGVEIDMRKETQDYTAVTSEVYDESITDYEGNMDIVNDMEILVPDDMEAPEETPAAATGGQAASPGLGASGSNTQTSGGTGTTGNTTGSGLGVSAASNDSSNTEKDKKDEEVK